MFPSAIQWLPGIHALHDDLILFALDHIIGEHGMEVGNGSSQNDPVGTKLMLSHLQHTHQKHTLLTPSLNNANTHTHGLLLLRPHREECVLRKELHMYPIIPELPFLNFLKLKHLQHTGDSCIGVKALPLSFPMEGFENPPIETVHIIQVLHVHHILGIMIYNFYNRIIHSRKFYFVTIVSL